MGERNVVKAAESARFVRTEVWQDRPKLCPMSVWSLLTGDLNRCLTSLRTSTETHASAKV